MSKRYKITRGKRNGFAAYPQTIVEAITWEGQKKSLEEVLNALAEGAGGDVKPIVLTEVPTSGMTTQAELDAIGLTVEEMQAAAEGKRTGVVIEGNFYPITQAILIGEHSEGVGVTFIQTGDDGEKFVFIEGFEVRSVDGVVTVVEYAS